jgi:hypothetical protein
MNGLARRLRRSQSWPQSVLGRYCLFLLVVASAPLRAAEPAPLLTWWIEGSLIKIRPFDHAPRPAPKEAYLKAARNEFEPFQVALRSDASDTDGIDVEISDFHGAGGARIPGDSVTVYAEQFVDLAKPSSVDGGTGLWPDPLIPRTDRYVHERRNAFPLSLHRGCTQPLWFEVYVPETAGPGSYTASATISRHGKSEFTVPIHLSVWAFALPSSAGFKTTFGLNGVTALKQHRGSYTSDADLYSITRLYAKAALLHRISTHGGSMAPPKHTCDGHGVSIDWHAYDSEVAPFLDGTAISKDEPLHGARVSTVELRTPASWDSNECAEAYYAAWTKHFQEKGWDSRLFFYLWDEPPPADISKVADRGRIALHAAPALRTLITTPFNTRLQDFVRIWVPLVNCLEPRPDFADYCADQPSLSAYQGKNLWFYQSCASHGCNSRGSPYFTGWPSYMIDAIGTANRIMPWVAWKFDIEGELYYSMNEAYSNERDPWSNIRMSGGNGDGTLFYPGRPSRIGGHNDIPIESIRLKLIREGLEDYEYLALAAKLGGKSLAGAFASRIVTEPYLWEPSPERFLDVRAELGDTLDNLTRSASAGATHAQQRY